MENTRRHRFALFRKIDSTIFGYAVALGAGWYAWQACLAWILSATPTSPDWGGAEVFLLFAILLAPLCGGMAFSKLVIWLFHSFFPTQSEQKSKGEGSALWIAFAAQCVSGIIFLLVLPHVDNPNSTLFPVVQFIETTLMRK